MNPAIESATAAIEKRFEPIVGQMRAKARITDILLGGVIDGEVAPMLFIAPPGWGKSHILKAVRDLVRDLLGKKTLLAKSGENLGTKAEFFEQIIIPKFHNIHSVILADEFQEAVRGVQSAIRSLLEPTADRSPREYEYNDSKVCFNPFLNSFVLATNEIDKLDAALVSRFERIDLEPFTTDEMGEILFMGLKGENFQFHEGALASLARCNRGSARDIIHWIGAIRRRMNIKGTKDIYNSDCMAVIRSRNCFPEGVTGLELSTMFSLEKRGELARKELADINQCTSDQQDANEKYLRGRGFIGINGKRYLTADGRSYLEMLRREGFIDSAK